MIQLKHHSGAQAASRPVCSYLTLHLQEPLGQDLKRLFPWPSALQVAADLNVALMALFDSILLLAGVLVLQPAHGSHLPYFLEQRNLKYMPSVLKHILLDSDSVIR